MYTLDYITYPSFSKQLSKYSKKYSNNREYKKLIKDITSTLTNSPRKSRESLNAHKIKDNIWAISTGMNSNRDRLVYRIDDTNKIIYLKSVGDHSVYRNESIIKQTFEEFLEEH